MFGFVTASLEELTEAQKGRYKAVYCGICRAIGKQEGPVCRLALQYDMAFLALLLMSLYEPEEQSGQNRCLRHPVKPNVWVDNEYIRYAARMNVVLACFKAKDDWADEGKTSARIMARRFGRHEAEIRAEYPRQCAAMEASIARLSRLEAENCADPDRMANAFGELMAELMVYREDLWAESLRVLGFHLGRFIYLADAAMDLAQDKKHGRYNPWLALGRAEDAEQYLVLAMAACTDAFERLPLVQDKEILDNILYSGVWLAYRANEKESRKENQDGPL
ncbi:MAG: hypothetical protein IJ960_03675 [Oscillospiraceae bacterium]|nr:hypothetical protein [Oscillospiraceae bacterium]